MGIIIVIANRARNRAFPAASIACSTRPDLIVDDTLCLWYDVL